MLVTQEQQNQANATSSAVRKATKVVVVIVGGIAGLFLIKLISILRKKKAKEISEQEADAQIQSLKADWYLKVSKTIENSWDNGIKLGLNASKEQGVSSTSGSYNNETLQSILDDVKRSIDDAVTLLEESVTNASDVESIKKSIILRQQMASDAALKFAVAEVMESELASPDTQKMWVPTSKVPCSHCAGLSGMVRDWGEEFPHQFNGIYKLKVYGGVLLHPPRHVHCCCQIVVVPKEK